jgi:hypothetical protein
MIRERVLTISTILALAALSSAAYAEPQGSGKATSRSAVAPSSQSRQTQPDWYRARAMQEGAPPAQIEHEGTSRQAGCRYIYSGGPKYPVTC